MKFGLTQIRKGILLAALLLGALLLLAAPAALWADGIPPQAGGEYELELTAADAPFHDILQVTLMREKEQWKLHLLEPSQSFALEVVAGQSLTLSGRDEKGELLYIPGAPFTVVLRTDAGGQVNGMRLFNSEVSYEGGKILDDGAVEQIARRPPAAPLAASAVLHDLRQLRRIMEHVHPALYAFTTQEQFARLFAGQEKRIEGRMTPNEVFALIAPLVARIGCGHAGIRLSAADETAAEEGLLPLKLHFAGAKAFLHQGVNTRIPPGSEIQAIDGLAMAEIIARLKTCITSDGLLDSTLIYRLTQNFPRLYASVYGRKTRAEVTYLAPGSGRSAHETVAGIGRDGLTVLWPKRAGATPQERHLAFAVLPEKKTAVLTIHSFGFYADKAGFRRFIDDAFTRIREQGVEHLILDLRDNDGGDPLCSSYLLKYLSPTPIPYFAKQYGESYAPLAQPHQPAAQPFTGKLWILIDGGCLSSTTHLCALLKHHRIGRFIGGETAGNHTCNDNSKTFLLSHSGLRVTLARATYAAAVSGMARDRGIVPDEPVQVKLADLLQGIDTVKEYALRRVGEKDDAGTE